MTSVTEECVRVRLRALIAPEIIRDIELQHGKYFLAVSGPGLQLGFCDHDRAPRMTSTGRDIWTKDLWILKDTTLKYNFVVIHRHTNDVLHYERISVREIGVGATSLTIDDTYNRVQFTFNNTRKKRRSRRRNRSRINTRSQNQISPRPDTERDRGDYQTITNESDKMPNDETRTTNVSDVPATDDMMKTVKASSPERVANDSAKDTGVKSVTIISQSEIVDNNVYRLSVVDEKYTSYLKLAGKIGFVALVAFGVCKLVLKR